MVSRSAPGRLDSALIFTICFLLPLLWSCDSGPSTLRETDVAIAVDAISFEYSSEAGILDGSLTVEVRNQGTTVVWLLPCSTGLQRRVDGEWQQVWSRYCLFSGGRSHEVAIRPGALFEDQVHLSERPGIGSYEYWAVPVDGTYRVHVLIRDRRGILSPDLSNSGPFEIQVAGG